MSRFLQKKVHPTPPAPDRRLAGERKGLQQAAKKRTAQLGAALKAELGDSRTASLGSGSSYKALYKRFVEYEQALDGGDVVRQEQLLEYLQGLSTRWLNDKQHQGRRDSGRRAAVDGLVDGVAAERVALSNYAAQEQYLGDAVDATSPTSLQALGGDPRGQAKHTWAKGDHASIDSKTQGIADYQMEGDDAAVADFQNQLAPLTRRKALMDSTGFTAAEATAIATYTNEEDYRYINGAVLGIRTVMDGARREMKAGPAKKQRREVLRAEGALHAGIATQGLAKLPRYSGTSFRGDAMSQERFDRDCREGGLTTTRVLTSTSQGLTVPERYASKSTAKNDISVLWRFTDVGHDISDFSLVASEQEVLVASGTLLRILTVRAVDKTWSGTEEIDEVARRLATAATPGHVRRVYMVTAELAERGPKRPHQATPRRASATVGPTATAADGTSSLGPALLGAKPSS